MKKIFLLATISILLVPQVNAQQVIAVQNGSNTLLYNSLDTAIINAQNGDTIYIPGGAFNINTPISKRLYIFGVGHNPDSTSATNFTQLSSATSISIISGADGGLLTGISACSLSFGTTPTNQSVHNYTIHRCNIQSVNLGISMANPSTATNNTFRENVFSLLQGFNTQNNSFSNNVIGLMQNFSTNNVFKNNVFLGCYSVCGSGGSWAPINNVLSSLFENNIFSSASAVSNCTFNNNMVGNWTLPNDCVGMNNIFNQSLGSIFMNYGSQTCGFTYKDNYHLVANCPGINAGTDGTDIGIYGSLSPWKEGSIPFNPHISSKNIDTQNNANGNIRIRIKVKAQSN